MCRITCPGSTVCDEYEETLYARLLRFEALIDLAWEEGMQHTPSAMDSLLRDTIHETIQMLDDGIISVAAINPLRADARHNWAVNWWIKRALIIYDRLVPNRMLGDSLESKSVMDPGRTFYWDNRHLKFSNWTETQFEAAKIIIAPPAIAQKGCFIGPKSIHKGIRIEMGAYVSSDVFIDDGAMVGSCAHIGMGVQISKNATVGGAMRPVELVPAVIEDRAFIGSFSKVSAGVLVSSEAILVGSVDLERETPIIDEIRGEVYRGYVPPRALVVTKRHAQSGLNLPHIVYYRRDEESRYAARDILNTFYRNVRIE
ncbi:2,3,4,5-tetrahydropyridine-2,6-dicarboxylate N-succinyltransferase [Magnetococcus marinus MC-1]|uniref:2,3,4,5-tetrahydropyridine-2,6-dicarboxylate N-succinyltransferase n=1 Tax=Magnetococcus marinus (strain ATCC BAA-1437 / JCM 17883 / MC-1) TaxID=156889 RepID=A0L503_MAGMM|nr:2,3,4,5-tetrahydropyridine-2,6-dicarboxylate N-succinyltransferase [Magnetococcus marinus MC-1]